MYDEGHGDFVKALVMTMVKGYERRLHAGSLQKLQGGFDCPIATLAVPGHESSNHRDCARIFKTPLVATQYRDALAKDELQTSKVRYTLGGQS